MPACVRASMKRKKKNKQTTARKKSVHANAYRYYEAIRFHSAFVQMFFVHSTHTLDAGPVISPVHENACAPVCARSLFCSTFRFFSFSAYFFWFFVRSILPVPSFVHCTRYFSNWMQLATLCLVHSFPFAANHLCLGNASKWISFFFISCLWWHALARAHVLSNMCTCCGVIYVHAGVRLYDRCSDRSFGSYSTCVTLWQVANACRRVGIGLFMHSIQVVRANWSGDEYYDRSVVCRSKM